MHSDRGEELVAYSLQDLGAVWRWRVYGVGGQLLRQGAELTREGAERAAVDLVFGGGGGSEPALAGVTQQWEPDRRLGSDSNMSDWLTYCPTASELLNEALRNGGRLEVVADKDDRPCPKGRVRLRLASQLCAQGLLRCDHPMARNGRPGEFIYDFTLRPAGVRALRDAAPAPRRAA